MLVPLICPVCGEEVFWNGHWPDLDSVHSAACWFMQDNSVVCSCMSYKRWVTLTCCAGASEDPASLLAVYAGNQM